MKYAVVADSADRLARFISATWGDCTSDGIETLLGLLGWTVDWATGTVFDAEKREVNLDEL